MPAFPIRKRVVRSPILGRGFGEPGAPHEDRRADNALSDGESGHLRAKLLELLSPTPVETDELIRQCGTDAAAVVTVLLELELSGRAERHPGNRISLA